MRTKFLWKILLFGTNHAENGTSISANVNPNMSSLWTSKADVRAHYQQVIKRHTKFDSAEKFYTVTYFKKEKVLTS